MAGSSDYVVGYIKTAAERAEQTMTDKRIGRQTPIAPTEQVARFLDGRERWRVEQGLVTPAQWEEYEMAMLRKIGGAK